MIKIVGLLSIIFQFNARAQSLEAPLLIKANSLVEELEEEKLQAFLNCLQKMGGSQKRAKSFMDSLVMRQNHQCGAIFPSTFAPEQAQKIRSMKKSFCENPVQFCEDVKCLSQKDHGHFFITKSCERATLSNFVRRKIAQLPEGNLHEARQAQVSLVDTSLGERRSKDVKLYFDEAKKATFKYLETLRPKAPRSVFEALEKTTLIDPTDPEQRELMKEMCSGLPETEQEDVPSYSASGDQKSLNNYRIRKYHELKFSWKRRLQKYSEDRIRKIEKEEGKKIDLGRRRELYQQFEKAREDYLAEIAKLMNRKLSLREEIEHLTKYELAELGRASLPGMDYSALGVNNASNIHFESEGSSQVLMCPQFALDAFLNNPRSLATVFLHELGHSLDPCRQGVKKLLKDFSDFFNSGNCSEDEKYLADEDLAFIARTHSLQRCLIETSEINPPPWTQMCTATNPGGDERIFQYNSVNSEISPVDKMFLQNSKRRSGRQVRGNDKQGIRGILDVMMEEASTNPALKAQARCLKKFHRELSGPSGFLATCPGTYFTGSLIIEAYALKFSHNFKKSPNKGRLDVALNRLIEEESFRDQRGEAFADYVAAQSLPGLYRQAMIAAKAKHPENIDEINAEVLTNLSLFCGFSFRPRDSHPHSSWRMGIFSASSELRKMMSCDEGIIEELTAPSVSAARKCQW